MFALPILHVTGLLVAGLGLAMVLPALIDLGAGNADWKIFVGSAVVTWTFGTLLALATRRPEAMHISVRQAFAMTASAWIALFSAFAAVPFLGTISPSHN